MHNSEASKTMAESSALGKYRLCSNSKVKFVFFVGLALQSLTLALAVSILSQPGWVQIDRSEGRDPGNRFSLTRSEGILQDCYLDIQPSVFSPHTTSKCYMKNFGQYEMNNDTSPREIAITTAGSILVALGVLGCGFTLAVGLLATFLWFRAPYDSFFMRIYRLLVGFSSAVTSCLIFAVVIVFHINLRMSVQHVPRTTLDSTTVTPTSTYSLVWACVGASVLAAWVIVASTCFWAEDYVNCRSVAAAYNPTCSQRVSTLSMSNNCIRDSIYSLDGNQVWNTQNPPTLPRYHTSTYGDGSEIRNRSVTANSEEDGKVKEKIDSSGAGI